MDRRRHCESKTTIDYHRHPARAGHDVRADRAGARPKQRSHQQRQRQQQHGRPSSDRSSDRRDRFRERDRSREAQTQSAEAVMLAPAPAGYTDKYAVLELRNVFLKDRSRPTSRPSSSSTQPSSHRSAEESLALRGIAIEDSGYRAYVEDLNTTAMLKVSPGDTLARGHVTAIELDAIAYEHDGKQMWVNIGNDLTGKTAPGATPTYGSSATTSPTTLPANIDLNDPSLTVEQRMKLRVQLQNQRRSQ
jgi:hypothetical protein